MADPSVFFAVDGDLLHRCDVFDEDDLDVGASQIRRAESPSSQRLENSAVKWVSASERHMRLGWDAMAEMLAEDSCYDDRRSVVNGGLRRGRDSMIEDMRSGADIGIPEFRVAEIATRGERLVLCRADSHYDVRPGSFMSKIS